MNIITISFIITRVTLFNVQKNVEATHTKTGKFAERTMASTVEST